MAAAVKERGLYLRGSRYYIRYAVNGQLRREAAGTNKKLALELLGKRRLEVAEGRYFPERTARRRQTLEETIDDHLERTTALRDQRNRRTHAAFWTKHLGSRGLTDVTPAHVERMLAKLGRSQATANRYLSFLKRVYAIAAGDGAIAHDPIRRMKLGKESKGRVRWLTQDEEPRLQATLEYWNGHSSDGTIAWLYVVLAMHTGMRQGEQWRARWSDLALDGKQLHIPLTKSGEARWVPLNATARAALAELRSLYGDVQPHERICNACSANYFMSDTFRPALERAKITGFRWHDLRHTFASRLVMAGVNLSTVQHLLGHKTIAMTQRYAHLSPEHLQSAVAQIEVTQKLTQQPKDAGTI